ncbi:MAG: hypothetical protein J4A00_07655 [Gammaproteobacteria bacterium]|nr:hypothetical protein [Gammaproteobacteria bacterium]
MSSGNERLIEAEDHYETAVGAMFPGERAVFRGYDLHRQLKSWEWLELYIYGVTGRHFSGDDLRILNTLFVFTSYPDPRIWLNRIAALAGTARSTGALGLSGAISAAEATILGPRANLRAIHFCQTTRKRVDAGEDLEEIVIGELRQRRVLYGFGRPVVSGDDERIAPTMKLLQEYGRVDGSHISLVQDIQTLLIKKRLRLRLNFGGLTAAICADFGLAPRQFYLGSLLSLAAGMLPGFVDTLEHEEGTFFPLHCNRVDYRGQEPRRWI